MLSYVKKKMQKGKYKISQESQENFVRNGACILEESISFFHSRINPIRYFSVDELNNMNVEGHPIFVDRFFGWYPGSWEERLVLLKLPRKLEPAEFIPSSLLREIVVATQMATHYNVHKILGCCIETESPVLVYERVEPKTIEDHIFNKDTVLEWKDRLRIAWEISHAVSYLHTAFPRPIIHRNLKPTNVFLNHEKTAYLYSFDQSVSIPEGEEFVKPKEMSGQEGLLMPSFFFSSELFHKDLPSGKDASFKILTVEENNGYTYILNWVRNGVKDNCISKIVDPAITRNGVTAIEDLKLRTCIQLALFCTTEEADSRPTMVEVATKLKNIIRSPESIPTTTIFQI